MSTGGSENKEDRKNTERDEELWSSVFSESKMVSKMVLTVIYWEAERGCLEACHSTKKARARSVIHYCH